MKYDIFNAKSIELHAKVLENKSFYEIIPTPDLEKASNKGGLGQLIEKHHFGYNPNSLSGPDFVEAGVELKLTPYKKVRKSKYSSKERLVLNIIDYEKLINEKFETSSFWNKNKLLLLIFYLYEKETNRSDFKITHAQLFSFPEKDLQIIKNDWNKIADKVSKGLAHELTEAETSYLGACTKGANKQSLRKQPKSSIKAMQRAFSLKSSYMTFILNEYILKKKVTYQTITDNVEDSLEDFIIKTYKKYYGETLANLIDRFGVSNSSKGKTYLVAAKMLNGELTDLNKTEEFIKSNTKIKAIRIQKNGKIKESMSFPTFKYLEIIKETWETSTLRNMFLETRFLFVVFKENEVGDYLFERSMFWNIPLSDVENEVKSVWEETVSRINLGRSNDLPKSSDNKVCHVRPHARNSRDTYQTPQGDNIVKKCFWLNNSYLLKQVNFNK
ncbi:Sau3AI family type II restriction endonuclease [Metabacillus idriensis]|uniref:Sau3AI family type II restriction endonuclease n=1 Tax=Metabacillus idriensis TaxID=324768 RepID=UPI00174EA217|nr:Sau3AI family type II restriction endonuclease [Metabacillus idriensis]